MKFLLDSKRNFIYMRATMYIRLLLTSYRLLLVCSLITIRVSASLHIHVSAGNKFSYSEARELARRQILFQDYNSCVWNCCCQLALTSDACQVAWKDRFFIPNNWWQTQIVWKSTLYYIVIEIIFFSLIRKQNFAQNILIQHGLLQGYGTRVSQPCDG